MAPQNHKEKNKKTKTIWVGKPTLPFEEDFIRGEQLGDAGQYGVTYRCTRRRDNLTFAVKQLDKNRYPKDPLRTRYLKAMRTEISILKRLKHFSIIHLEAVYEDEGTLYIVMEECKGKELFARIVERKKYTEKEARRVIKQILEALKYMHEVHKVIHCDLKPSNIMFFNVSEKSPLKLIDFGMSKILPRLQYETVPCGTR